ncbi:MAG: hypothetical protein ACKVZ0_15540 [Gemmatimonadales bacterium]
MKSVPFATLLLGAVSTALGQSRETLETKVTAVRGNIVLEWSKKHPWDAQLAATPPYLLVEYQTSDGRVAIDCLVAPNAAPGRGPAGCFGIPAEGTPGSRTWRFRLPEQVSRVPQGPICLAIRLPNQRVLPIRRTDQSRSETSRFRYPEWEALAVFRAAARTKDSRTALLRDSVALVTERIRLAQSTNQLNGWTSEAGCPSAGPPAFVETGGVRRPVAPDSLTSQITSLVCILKVKNADLVKPEYRYSIVQSPATIDRLLQALSPTFRTRFLATRAGQVERYRRDWNDMGPEVEPYRNALAARDFGAPHFGRFNDFISIQSIAADSAERDIFRPLANGAVPDSQRVAGYIGANLEAYSVCRSDGVKQLATAREAAVGFGGRTAALQDRARQQMVEACQASFATVARLGQELEAMKARLAAIEQAAGAGAPPVPGDNVHQLNMSACTP